LQPPLAEVTRTHAVPRTIALLCVMIGSTSFDGFSQGPIWNGSDEFRGIAEPLQNFFHDTLGLSLGSALEAAFTVGLVGMILPIAGFYRLGGRA
jgi:hypothetical protein